MNRRAFLAVAVVVLLLAALGIWTWWTPPEQGLGTVPTQAETGAFAGSPGESSTDPLPGLNDGLPAEPAAPDDEAPPSTEPSPAVDPAPQRPAALPASALSEPHVPVPRGKLASYLELVLTVEKAEVTLDESIVFRLTLRNIGDLPVQAIKPRISNSRGGIVVYDLNGHMTDGKMRHLRYSRGPWMLRPLRKSDIIELAPGAEVECAIDRPNERWATWAKTYKDPGRYGFRMVYVFQRARGERPSVEGDPERTVEASDWAALQRVDEGEVWSNEVFVVRKE